MGDDQARRLILARRARFVAAALASVAATAAVGAGTEGCAGEIEQTDGGVSDAATPQPCLKKAPDDAGPKPCLDVIGPEPEDAGPDAEPQPCLFAPVDGG
jgi:hypothetical protein